MIDRNQRARAMHRAEALDRRTRLKGQHGGVLKRTGLAVYKTLLFQFASVATGRCDPSFDRIAEVAGVARSTVAKALARLEAAGLVVRRPRARWVRANGGRVRVQATNAYAFVVPESENRAQTTNQKKTCPKSARSVPPSTTAPSPAPPHPGCDTILASARRLGIPFLATPTA